MKVKYESKWFNAQKMTRGSIECVKDDEESEPWGDDRDDRKKDKLSLLKLN